MIADYPEAVLAHFDRPRHAGELPSGPGRAVTGRAGDPASGLDVRFELRIHDDHVVAIAFRVLGCPYVIAACSLAAESLSGAPVAAVGRLEAAGLAASLRAPRERVGRLLAIEDALRKCLSAWENSGL